MIRYDVHFEGRVQGVGFRYTTARIAAAHAVVGYVRNLGDGRVHVAAEGEPAELDGFIGAICRRMEDHISGHRVERLAATGAFGVPGEGRFEVRY